MKSARRAAVITVLLLVLVTVAIAAQRSPRAIPIAAAETVLVYSPHPDDETYGMGQAIAEQSLAGRRVIGILVTDGDGSGEIPQWITSQGNDVDGDGDIDEWDFGLTRRSEYRTAMSALGVDELIFLGSASSQGREGFEDGDLGESADDILAAIESIVASVSPDAPIAHMTVATVDSANPLEREPREHPDHTVVSSVVSGLASDRGEELHLYKVYVFYQDQWWERWSTRIVRGSDAAIARKRDAIEAYSRIGRASTERLWGTSYRSDVEYLALQR